MAFQPDSALAGEESLGRPDQVHQTLGRAFEALNHQGVVWALLRGAAELAAPVGDVDLLLAPEMLVEAMHALSGAGFTLVAAAGHGSHRFFYSYDPDGLWIKLDLVTEIAFGKFQQFRTGTIVDCLERRRAVGQVWRLDPADEAWLFLLHQVLDKGRVRSSHAAATAAALDVAASRDPLSHKVRGLAGSVTPDVMLAQLRVGDDKSIGALRKAMQDQWWRHDAVDTGRRLLVNRVARRLGGLARQSRPGLVITVMGPDGAGKTTVLNGIRAELPVPNRYVYMGLWGKTRFDAVLRRTPGGQVSQKISRAASSSLTARYQRFRGRLVLVDRFVYDAVLPGSKDLSLGGRLVTRVSMRIAPAPDLILVMDAPGEMMFARKGEHTVEILEQRRLSYLAFAREIPQSVVIDATQSMAQVRRQVVAVVWERYRTGGERVKVRMAALAGLGA